MPLSKDEQKYYEEYFDMFSRPGWKNFEDEIKDTLSGLQRDLETSLEPRTSRIQGQIQELRFFINFRDGITRAYDDLMKPVENDD